MSPDSSFFFHPDGPRRVNRRRCERFADAYVIERDRLGDDSVMVWQRYLTGLRHRWLWLLRT